MDQRAKRKHFVASSLLVVQFVLLSLSCCGGSGGVLGAALNESLESEETTTVIATTASTTVAAAEGDNVTESSSLASGKNKTEGDKEELVASTTDNFDFVNANYQYSTFAPLSFNFTDSMETFSKEEEVFIPSDFFPTTESEDAATTEMSSMEMSGEDVNATQTRKSSVRFSNFQVQDTGYGVDFGEKKSVKSAEESDDNEVTTTTERKAKLVVLPDGEEGRGFKNTDGAELWALAGMMGLEDTAQQHGHFQNITSVSDTATGVNNTLKSLMDWSEIIKNVDFQNTSFSREGVNVSLSSTTTAAPVAGDQIADVQVAENKVSVNQILTTTKATAEIRRMDGQESKMSTPSDAILTTVLPTVTTTENGVAITTEEPLITSTESPETTTDFFSRFDTTFESSEENSREIRSTTERSLPTTTEESIEITTFRNRFSGSSSTKQPLPTTTTTSTTERLPFETTTLPAPTLSPRKVDPQTTILTPHFTPETTPQPSTERPVYRFTTEIVPTNGDIWVVEPETPKTTSSTAEITQSSAAPTPDDGGSNATTIIAISVVTAGILVALIVAAAVYYVRQRKKKMTYSQRCRPVSLDAYSLDNISVYNSTRRKANNLRLSKRSYGNSAFEDPGLESNPLTIAALSTFIQSKYSIYDEFKKVPTVTSRVDEVPEGCEDKNRYANVVPLPETRVHLRRLNGDEKTEYINANYVKGPKDTTNYYIATQAPLESTVPDFWRLVWEQNVKVIIMATDLTEGGHEKCADYLPPSVTLDNVHTYGTLQVTLKSREVKDKYAVSMLHLKNLATKSWREIVHFWYRWPETGVPSDYESIIAMLLEARGHLKMSEAERAEEEPELKIVTTSLTNGDSVGGGGGGGGNNNEDLTVNGGTTDKQRSLQRIQGPLLIHCSPGTSRTGTLIACDIVLRTLDMPPRQVDVPKVVYSVRRGRASAVQTKEQYELIYRLANAYATKITSPNVDN